MILYSGMWERVFGPDGAAVMSSGHLEVNKQTGQKSEEEVRLGVGAGIVLLFPPAAAI